MEREEVEMFICGILYNHVDERDRWEVIHQIADKWMEDQLKAFQRGVDAVCER